jgi:hypothetical protein
MPDLGPCPQCGTQASGGGWNCNVCGAELSPPQTDTDRTMLRVGVPGYPPPPPSPIISGIPQTAWPHEETVARPTPSATNLRSARVAPQPMSPASSPHRLPGSPRWIPRAAVALAVLGTATLVWLVVGRGRDDTQTASPASSLVEPTSVESATAPAEVATTVPATTIAETTTIAVAPAPPPPAFTPPAVPETPVFAGPGVAYSIADPLPSGPTVAEVQPELLVAQSIADLLAADQWDVALQSLFFFDGETKHPTIEALQAQWGSADRLSLVLLDAQKDPQGSGYNLLLGTVANLNDGTTNVLCNHLYVEAVPAPAVVDLGNASVVSQDTGPFMPEQLLNAADRVSLLRTTCVWPS